MGPRPLRWVDVESISHRASHYGALEELLAREVVNGDVVPRGRRSRRVAIGEPFPLPREVVVAKDGGAPLEHFVEDVTGAYVEWQRGEVLDDYELRPVESVVEFPAAWGPRGADGQSRQLEVGPRAGDGSNRVSELTKRVNPFGGLDADAVTTASNSMIDRAIPTNLGIKTVGETTLTSATHVDVPTHLFDLTFVLMEGFIKEVRCMESDFTGRSFQAIIGRDILASCILVYTGWTNTFTLSQ